MNQMSAFDPQDMQGDPGMKQPAMSPASFTIKRLGKRPLTFEGTELCMAMSFVPNTPFWYEINIYRTVTQGFVVAVRLFFQSEDERDRVRAWECETVDQAFDCLEGYDAGADVRVGRQADDPDLTAAELAAHAFVLRSRVQAQRDQYHGLVGEILDELAR